MCSTLSFICYCLLSVDFIINNFGETIEEIFVFESAKLFVISGDSKQKRFPQQKW